jgi:hypothetical protein
VIRWREIEIAPDGTRKRVLRYETLASMSRREAADILAQKLAAAGHKGPVRSRVTFRTLVNEWQATVLPMYKPSTQKNHRHIAAKHLVPRPSHAVRLRTEDRRSHSRCSECGT